MGRAKEIEIVLKVANDINRPIRELQDALKELTGAQRDFVSTVRDTNRVINDLDRNSDRAAKGMKGFKQAIMEAEIGAKAIEKMADGLKDGITNAFQGISGMASSAFGFVKDRFKEAMNDELSDIQARGSMFGSLTQSGVIKAGQVGGYKLASQIYKKIDVEIARQIASSTAPTETIVALNRGLSDNIFPELYKDFIKKGMGSDKAMSKAAKEMAQLYEQASIVAPPSIDAGNITKAITDLLGGSSLKSLKRLVFFSTNPTLTAALEKGGLASAKTVYERIKILQKAMSSAMSPEALAEMRSTLSAGIQALNDNLLDPTVGIFSFGREFDIEGNAIDKGLQERQHALLTQLVKSGKLDLKGESLPDYLKRMTTPLKIIGSTLVPFMQELAVLLGGAGTVMGHLSQLFVQYVSPILAIWTKNLRVLIADLESGRTNFPRALGRMAAEVVKQITQGFDVDGLTNSVNEGLNSFFTEFWRGFESLGISVDWKSMGDEIGSILTEVALMPGIREMLGALFLAFAAPSIVSAIASSVLLLLMAPISAFMTASVIPAATGGLAAIGGALASAVGVLTAPITGLIALIIAVVALCVGFFIRYKTELSNFFTNLGKAIASDIDLVAAQLETKIGEFVNWIVKGVDGVINFLRGLPIIGKAFGEGKSNLAEGSGQHLEALQAKQEALQKDNDQAWSNVSNSFKELSSAIGRDLNVVGSVVSKGWEVATNAMKGVGKGLQSATKFIDNLGGGVKTTTSAVNNCSTAASKTTSNINNATNATKNGSNSAVNAIKACTQAAKSIGSGSGISSGGSSMGSIGTEKGGPRPLSDAPVSPHSFRANHPAYDLGVNQGSKVALAVPGTITTSAMTNGACGGMVQGTMADGTPFKMCHFSKVAGKIGQVAAGEVLGLSGGTPGTVGAGRSTYAHIHLEPQNMNVARKILVRNKGLCSSCSGSSHMASGLQQAALKETAKMPTGSNLVLANSSEAILTKQQANAVDSMLSIGGSTNGSVNVQLKVELNALDPRSLDDSLLETIGSKLASGVASKLSSGLSSSSLSYIGV